MKETFTEIHIKIMETQLDRWFAILDNLADYFLIEDEESRREKIQDVYERVGAYYQMVHYHIEDLQEKVEARRANN